jgi:hypothetical protein
VGSGWKASRRSASGTASRSCPCISTGERHSLAALGQAMSLVEPERSLDTDGSRQPQLRKAGVTRSAFTSRLMTREHRSPMRQRVGYLRVAIHSGARSWNRRGDTGPAVPFSGALRRIPLGHVSQGSAPIGGAGYGFRIEGYGTEGMPQTSVSRSRNASMFSGLMTTKGSSSSFQAHSCRITRPPQ